MSTPESEPAGAAPTRRTWLRGVLSTAAAASTMVFLGGSRCFVTTEDDDDFDDDDFDDDDFWDDDDDDDEGSSTALSGPASLRLERFRLVRSGVAGSHPIAGVTDIEGVSVSAWRPDATLGAAELLAFTRAVLEANEDLLGLPAEAGGLRADTVVFHPDHVEVRWQQVKPGSAGTRAVAGGGMRFTLDLVGNLVAIDNTTRW